MSEETEHPEIDIVQEITRKKAEILSIIPATRGMYQVVRLHGNGKVPHRFTGDWNELGKLTKRIKAYNEQTEVFK